MRVRNWLAALVCLFAVAVSNAASAQESCPQGHCSRVAAALNNFCIANGMAGRPFLVFGPNGEMCYCPCSCVTSKTLISYADGRRAAIGTSTVGNLVANPFAEEGYGSVDVRLMSQVEKATVLRITFSNSATIVASVNHPFVLPDETVSSADKLRVGEAVLDANLRPVRITRIEKIQDFSGELHNLITERKSTAAQDHVVVTNGILSGDWLMQANNDQVEQSISLRTGSLVLFDGSSIHDAR